MTDNRDDFVLGAEVTRRARSRKRGGDSVVLSVRLSKEEFAEVEQASRILGKTISQVAREGVAAYAKQLAEVTTGPHVRWSFATSNGTAGAYGPPENMSGTSRYEQSGFATSPA